MFDSKMRGVQYETPRTEAKHMVNNFIVQSSWCPFEVSGSSSKPTDPQG